MDQSRDTVENLADQLRGIGVPAHLRALLLRQGEQWQVHYLWAVVGIEPPNWETATWHYEELAFLGWTMPSSDLANLLSTDGATTQTQGLQIVLSALQEHAQLERQPGFARYRSPTLPTPTLDYTLSPAEPTTGATLSHRMLVGPSCPSFPDVNSAWRAFFAGDYSLIGAQQPPTGALIRLVQDDAWIEHVHVSPTSLSVQIGGTQAAGCELELFGLSDRSTRQLDGPGANTFALENGLPDQAWIWLKRDTQWLDYRAFSQPWAVPDLPADASVDFEIPDEPRAALEALIASGEGPNLEFKREIPTSTEAKRKVFKTVAAFANADGGTLVFGIDPDELTVPGIDTDNPTRLRDQIGDVLRAVVIPTPQYSTAVQDLDGKLLLVLTISPGQSPPYGLAVDPSTRNKPEFYVRRGASTYPAQPNDLREAVRLRELPIGSNHQTIIYNS